MNRFFSVILLFYSIGLLGQLTIGSVEFLSPKMNLLVDPQAKIEVLAKGFQWAEGPVWVDRIDALLFSDVAANKMFLGIVNNTKDLF